MFFPKFLPVRLRMGEGRCSGEVGVFRMVSGVVGSVAGCIIQGVVGVILSSS